MTNAGPDTDPSRAPVTRMRRVCAALFVVCLVACSGGRDRVPPSPTGQAASATPGVLDQWTALHRPFASPASGAEACPVRTSRPVDPTFGPAIGDGPAYVALGTGVLMQSPTAMYKALWFADPAYRGPLLVRGRRLDGAGTVAFQLGVPGTPIPELHFTRDDPASSGTGGWRAWPTETLVSTPGCYAFQADGEGFTQTIIFQVAP